MPTLLVWLARAIVLLGLAAAFVACDSVHVDQIDDDPPPTEEPSDPADPTDPEQPFVAMAGQNFVCPPDAIMAGDEFTLAAVFDNPDTATRPWTYFIEGPEAFNANNSSYGAGVFTARAVATPGVDELEYTLTLGNQEGSMYTETCVVSVNNPPQEWVAGAVDFVYLVAHNPEEFITVDPVAVQTFSTTASRFVNDVNSTKRVHPAHEFGLVQNNTRLRLAAVGRDLPSAGGVFATADLTGGIAGRGGFGNHPRGSTGNTILGDGTRDVILWFDKPLEVTGYTIEKLVDVASRIQVLDDSSSGW